MTCIVTPTPAFVIKTRAHPTDTRAAVSLALASSPPDTPSPTIKPGQKLFLNICWTPATGQQLPVPEIAVYLSIDAVLAVLAQQTPPDRALPVLLSLPRTDVDKGMSSSRLLWEAKETEGKEAAVLDVLFHPKIVHLASADPQTKAYLACVYMYVGIQITLTQEIVRAIQEVQDEWPALVLDRAFTSPKMLSKGLLVPRPVIPLAPTPTNPLPSGHSDGQPLKDEEPAIILPSRSAEAEDKGESKAQRSGLRGMPGRLESTSEAQESLLLKPTSTRKFDKASMPATATSTSSQSEIKKGRTPKIQSCTISDTSTADTTKTTRAIHLILSTPDLVSFCFLISPYCRPSQLIRDRRPRCCRTPNWSPIRMRLA